MTPYLNIEGWGVIKGEYDIWHWYHHPCQTYLPSGSNAKCPKCKDKIKGEVREKIRELSYWVGLFERE